MPEEIRRLYVYETKDENKKELEGFMYKYGDIKIVEILLKKDLEDIAKVYEIPHNIRRLVFSFYFIRDYKKIVKKEINKVKKIENKDEFMSRFEMLIERWEVAMYMSKIEWLKV